MNNTIFRIVTNGNKFGIEYREYEDCVKKHTPKYFKSFKLLKIIFFGGELVEWNYESDLDKCWRPIFEYKGCSYSDSIGSDRLMFNTKNEALEYIKEKYGLHGLSCVEGNKEIWEKC